MNNTEVVPSKLVKELYRIRNSGKYNMITDSVDLIVNMLDRDILEAGWLFSSGKIDAEKYGAALDEVSKLVRIERMKNIKKSSSN